MRIELFGMPIFAIEFKPKPQPEKEISGKELEEARKEVIEHVFIKTGIDKSTIELVLITTDNYLEGQ